MKLYVITKNNPFVCSTASSNRLLSLLIGLVNLDRKVDISILITGGYTSRKEADDFGGSGMKMKICYQYINSSIVDSIWKRRWDTYIGSKIRQPIVYREILRISSESGESVFWPQCDLMILRPIYWVLKRNPRLKLFMELSEFLDVHRLHSGNFLQRLKGDNFQVFFETKIFPKLSGLALMTSTLLKHYSMFANHPKLIHLAMTVDLDRFRAISTPPEVFKSPYIAFVGVMNDAKDGVNILVKAFAQISQTYPDLKLYLVGSWNYDTPGHLVQIEELGMTSRIFWMGEYPKNIIPSIIKGAKLLVLPRPDSKQAQGGFPTKLGEYLATGNPVCATTVGEIPNYLEDGDSVFFAKPGDSDEFARVMDIALENPGNAMRVGNNGKKVAEMQFNHNIQAIKLYGFLKEL